MEKLDREILFLKQESDNSIKVELKKLLQKEIRNKIEKIQTNKKVNNEKQEFEENEKYINLQINEIDEFLSKKEKNNNLEKYKKTFYELFIFYFTQIRIFKNSPEGENNFIFSFIASQNQYSQIIFDIINFFQQKNQIKDQFKKISKIEDIFSIKKEVDISKLVFLIINDDFLKMKISDCENNKEVNIFKSDKNGFFSKAKRFFKFNYLDTFESNSQILAFLDFEFLKGLLFQKNFPTNWNYNQKINSLFSDLKKIKYGQTQNLEKNPKNIQNLKLKKITISLQKQYSNFSKHDVNFFLTQKNKKLVQKNFLKAEKILTTNFQKSIFFKKDILSVELIIRGNGKDHFLNGKFDFAGFNGANRVKFDVFNPKHSSKRGEVDLYFE